MHNFLNKTALYYAITNSNKELRRFLIINDNKDKAFNGKLLYEAVEKENIKAVKILLAIDDIDVNILVVFNNSLFMKFKIINFNKV